MTIRRLVKTATAITALVAGGIVAMPGTASAVNTAEPFCGVAYGVVAGNGWSVFAPTDIHRTGVTGQACYLRYGDRTPAVQQLKANLRYCYGKNLANSALFDTDTTLAITAVQRLHGITADGVYGPQTFKAMRWRMYNAQATESTNCYRPFAARTVRTTPPAGAYGPDCRVTAGRYAGNGWWIDLPGSITRYATTTFACYLKPGDRGDGVGDLQYTLRDCYRATLPVTTVYDSRTRATVAAVQRLHKITADGIYGPATMKAMYWRMRSTHGYSEKCYSPF